MRRDHRRRIPQHWSWKSVSNLCSALINLLSNIRSVRLHIIFQATKSFWSWSAQIYQQTTNSTNTQRDFDENVLEASWKAMEQFRFVRSSVVTRLSGSEHCLNWIILLERIPQHFNSIRENVRSLFYWHFVAFNAYLSLPAFLQCNRTHLHKRFIVVASNNRALLKEKGQWKE